MKTGISKIRGSILTILFLFITSISLAGEIETHLSRNRISTGETTNLEIKISASSSDIEIVKAAKIDGLNISYTGTSTSFQFINGKTWSGTTYTYVIEGLKKGTYKIPSFIFLINGTRTKTDNPRLIVTKGIRRTGHNSSGVRGMKGYVELNKKEAYIGQAIVMRYYLLSTGIRDIKIQGIEKQPGAKGFIVNKLSESVDDRIISEGENEMVMSHLYSYILIPSETGNLTSGGGTVIVAINYGESVFSFMKQRRVKFNKEKIKILPLPLTGKPESFHGDVGTFTIELNYENSPVKVYDEKIITIKIKGQGNFLSLTGPFLKKIKDVKILKQDGESKVEIKDNNLSGEKEFVYTLIPEKAGKIDLGKITFTFFDPILKQYKIVATEEISFQATGKSSKINEEVKFSADKKEKIDFNPLYIIAIILGIIVIIILIIALERKKMASISKESSITKKDRVIKTEQFSPIAHISEIEIELNKSDFNRFLSLCDRALSEKSKSLNSSNETINDIEKMKEKIYHFKFGAAPLSDTLLKELFIEIKGILNKK